MSDSATALRDEESSCVVEVPAVQQRMWAADRLSKNASSHLIPLHLHITGRLDVGALRRALVEIVTRHQILRTSVQMVDGEMVGLLRPAALFALETRHVDPSEVDLVRLDEATTPLDVEESLPFRAQLLRLDPQRSVLCLSVHHLAFDGGSRDILYRELAALYNAFATGEPISLGEVNQYRDIVRSAQQDGRLQPAELQWQRAFWRRALDGLVPFEVPTDRPRPLRRAGRGAAQSFEVKANDVAGLRELARESGVSLHMALVAVCQVVLGRLAGRSDVTVGSTYNVRFDPELRSVIGPLINLAVLRGDLSGDPTFRTLLHRCRDTALAVYDALDLAFEDVVQAVGASRDLDRTPLFGIAIDVRRSGSRVDLHGLEVRELPELVSGSKFDLSLAFEDTGCSLTGRVIWDVSLYRQATVQRLVSELGAVLADAVKRPDIGISRLRSSAAGEK